MKQLKKVPVLSLIIGIVVLAYAIISWIVDDGIFKLSATVGNIVIAVGLIAFAVFIVLPKVDGNNNKTSKMLRMTELIVLLIGAIVGFILPVFDVRIAHLGSGSLWFGIALVLDGGIGLYLGTGGKVSARGWRFFGYLFSVMLGTWIYAVNYVDSKIKIVTFIALLVIGLYCFLIGLFGLNKKRK
ncbi:MAG: hypothetical protein RBQ97_06580 [Acholeplasma sp.]|nr:hypothetical protein [Acholeplasma sp.]